MKQARFINLYLLHRASPAFYAAGILAAYFNEQATICGSLTATFGAGMEESASLIK